MFYELEDTSKVEHLFAGWEETMIYSCLDHTMGKIIVTDLERPTSALAIIACFAFFAGEVDKELFDSLNEDIFILTPHNVLWENAIEARYPTSRRRIRYSTKKNTKFNRDLLEKNLTLLEEGYEIKAIDAKLYDLCLENAMSLDFVSSYKDKEDYLSKGMGIVIIKDNEIVSGASSFTSYKGGIEIEIDTKEDERRHHLATIAASKLILKCLDRNLYPSWDAQNKISLHLAEKLGYEFNEEYVVYEL